MRDLQKKEVLNQICTSKALSNAPTSIALLRYLFEATLLHTDLKEAIIELEFFGKKNNSKKETPRVRVNVYNLRKKLDQYYENEGKNDSYRLIIDKGQYMVRFEKRSHHRNWKPTVTLSSIPYLVVVLLLAWLIAILIPSKKPTVWRAFLQQESPCTLYVGDVFGMLGETITGGTGWTRDYYINNLDDFYALGDSVPELKAKLQPPGYSYTTQMAVLSTQNFQSLFSSYKERFDIRFISKSSIDDIKSGNAIYVGPIKNDNPFIDLFNQANPNFNLKDSLLYFHQHLNLKDTVFKFPYQISDDELAIVSKIPGPNHTEQILFFSNHDIGVSATVQCFTDINYLSYFEKEIANGYTYFTAIYRVRGMNRTDTGIDLVMFVGI